MQTMSRSQVLHSPLSRKAVAAAGAALGLLLLLATAPVGRNIAEHHRMAAALSAVAQQIAQGAMSEAQASTHIVNKCVVDGVTSYSDTPCAPGTPAGRITLPAEPPLPAPALAARNPLPDTTPVVRQARCDAARAELRNIDALTTAGQPADMQAFLDARRAEKRNELFSYRC